MNAWFQTEITYPFVPNEVLNDTDSVRGTLPSQYCQPELAAQLFDESIDEYLLCDDLGINMICTEHHAGINSLIASNPMMVGILAAQSKKTRLLSLGTLISLRPDPIRVAEEYATADVISRGRLEIGFVKSGLSEFASNQTNPVDNGERYWEAIDLISHALSRHDGVFSWEGKYFTHRHVNIWPRPYQDKLPRMWSATGDPSTAADVGRRDMVQVLVMRGPEGTKAAFAANRKARAQAGMPKAQTDKFAYAAFVAVGDTDEEGIALGEKLLWFFNTGLRSAPQFGAVMPGTAPPHAAPSIYRSKAVTPTNGTASSVAGNIAALSSLTAEQAMARGILFAGSPDSVTKQIMDFHEKVGGFDHLSMVGRSGFMTHEETCKSMTLFAREVLPRIQEVPTMEAGYNQPA
jgi:alkanesulfonate monooxygenase SsuD/methylene tetrahydromethanopterin reductase-like flavin-dependent oxidoreductase (luciferase family)